MGQRSTGTYVTISTIGEACRAFVPAPLPPSPPIDWTPTLRDAFDRALLALGRLDSVSRLLPDTSLLLYTYVRKEAVLSSQIEGTQSSLADLLLFELDETPGVPLDDVQEVSNYVAALDHGMARLRAGFPLSVRLIREIHGVLLARGRGSDRDPGEFRRSQNWIGGTRPGNARFVPPPPDAVPDCMGTLERFLHDDPARTPTLLKAALAHVQFETIHPFLDGNGRVGRLLITLVLCAERVLAEPLLYLSLYFRAHRQTYYELLNAVRDGGDWEAWLAFFAEAVTVTAEQAVRTSDLLTDLARRDHQRLAGLGRAAGSALRVHHELLRRPIASSTSLVAATGLAPATVNAALTRLQAFDVASELTGLRRNRLFAYTEYIRIVNEGITQADDG